MIHRVKAFIFIYLAGLLLLASIVGYNPLMQHLRALPDRLQIQLFLPRLQEAGRPHPFYMSAIDLNQPRGIADMPINLVLRDHAGRPSLPLSIETDAHGFAVGEIPPLEPGFYSLGMKRPAGQASETAALPFLVRPPVQWRLETDKPYYRPGGTVHLMVHARHGSQKMPLADTGAVVSLESRARELLTLPLQTNGWGYAHTVFRLGSQLDEGSYALLLRHEGQVVASAAFYVAVNPPQPDPAAILQVMPLRRHLVKGVEQQIPLRLAYPDGKAVSTGWIQCAGQTVAVKDGLGWLTLPAQQVAERLFFHAGDPTGRIQQGELLFSLEDHLAVYPLRTDAVGLDVLAASAADTLFFVLGQEDRILAAGTRPLTKASTRLTLEPSVKPEFGQPIWLSAYLASQPAAVFWYSGWLEEPGQLEEPVLQLEKPMVFPGESIPIAVSPGQARFPMLLEYLHQLGPAQLPSPGRLPWTQFAWGVTLPQGLVFYLWPILLGLAGLLILFGLAASPGLWLGRLLQRPAQPLEEVPPLPVFKQAQRAVQCFRYGALWFFIGALCALAYLMTPFAFWQVGLVIGGLGLGWVATLAPIRLSWDWLQRFQTGLGVYTLGFMAVSGSSSLLFTALLPCEQLWGFLLLQALLWLRIAWCFQQTFVPFIGQKNFLADSRPNRAYFRGVFLLGCMPVLYILLWQNGLLAVPERMAGPQEGLQPRHVIGGAAPVGWSEVSPADAHFHMEALLVPSPGPFRYSLPPAYQSGDHQLRVRAFYADGQSETWRRPVPVQPGLVTDFSPPRYALQGDSLQLPAQVRNETPERQSMTLWLNQKEVASLLLQPQQKQALAIPWLFGAAGPTELRLEQRSSLPLLSRSQIVHVILPRASQPHPLISLEIEYPHTQAVAGEELPVTVSLSHGASQADVFGVQLGVPAGYEPQLETFSDTHNQAWIDRLQVADGFINIVTQPIPPLAPIEFHYRLRNTIPGQVRIPASHLFFYNRPSERASFVPDVKLEAQAK